MGDICTDDSGNQCCAAVGMAGHEYKIIRSSGLSWSQLELQCKTEKPGFSKLAVFESQRENDCVTKFLLDEYEDSTAQQYAIGIRVDDTYTGVYEWDRVETSIDNQDAATLAFSNWVPAAPMGKSCVAMTVGVGDTNNVRWTDVDCSTPSTLYAICEKTPTV